VRGWLVLYTHDVDDSPSAYGCTPGLLQAAVEAAVESGAELLTLDAGLARIVG
jgi:hypothetical protein